MSEIIKKLDAASKEYALDNYARRHMNDPSDYAVKDLIDVEELAYKEGAITFKNQTLDTFVAELEKNIIGKFVSLAFIKQTAKRMKGES